MTGSYSNPLRGLERRLSPSYEQRQFRDPGLAGMSSGLGSLHHGMPMHMGKLQRLQSGGSINPVGEIYASVKPNLYNPDPMRRRILQSVTFNPRNAAFTAAPGSDMPFPYADGGQSTEEGPDGGQDFEDVMQPEDQQSEPDDQERQVVLEAMAALEGEAEDPEEAIAHFIDVFGPRALKDLQRMVESKHREESGDEEEGGEEEQGEDEQEQQPQEGEESDSQDDLASMLQQMGGSPGQEDQLAGAGGGLLHGPGTGQSDEIEGTTPTGRPVLLSDGEYVFDAPTVAALGDGSTNAGARRLDALRRKIREDSYGNDKQAKPMRKGGITF